MAAQEGASVKMTQSLVRGPCAKSQACESSQGGSSVCPGNPPPGQTGHRSRVSVKPED